MDEHFGGTYVIGERGTGKSTFLEHRIVEQVETGNGVIVIEGHGDMTRNLLRMLPREREQDVVFLDAEQGEHPFGLNLFEKPEDPRLIGRATTQVMELFKKVWGDRSWGPVIEDTLQMVTLTAHDNQGMTLVDVPTLFADREYRERRVGNVQDRTVRLWWQTFEEMSAYHKTEYTNSTLNKIRQWVTHPIIMPIVGQATSSVDWRQAMDSGKIVLVRLPPSIGATAVSLLGTAIVNQVMLAAFSRGDIVEGERRPVSFVCDEFHLFATRDFADLFNGGRKFRIMTTVAHQQLAQIEDDQVKAAAIGAAEKVVFRVSGDDAVQLAKHFDHTPPPAEITGQRPVQSLAVKPADYLRTHGHRHPVCARLCEELRTFYEIFIDDGPDRAFYEERKYQVKDVGVQGTLQRAAYDRKYAQSTVQRREFWSYLNGYFSWRMQHGPGDNAMNATVRSRVETLLDGNDDAFEYSTMMMKIGTWLHHDPIYEQSGAYEPIYGAVRTYADMENEITTTLAHLPVFVYRLTSPWGEETVTAAPPLPLHDPLVPPQIGQPRGDILAAIRARQEPVEVFYDRPKRR